MENSAELATRAAGSRTLKSGCSQTARVGGSRAGYEAGSSALKSGCSCQDALSNRNPLFLADGAGAWGARRDKLELGGGSSDGGRSAGASGLAAARRGVGGRGGGGGF